MDNKICTVCNIGDHINKFCRKYSECKDCNIKKLKNFTMVIKIKYQLNNRYIMKKKRDKTITENKVITGNRRKNRL